MQLGIDRGGDEPHSLAQSLEKPIPCPLLRVTLVTSFQQTVFATQDFLLALTPGIV